MVQVELFWNSWKQILLSSKLFFLSSFLLGWLQLPCPDLFVCFFEPLTKKKGGGGGGNRLPDCTSE